MCPSRKKKVKLKSKCIYSPAQIVKSNDLFEEIESHVLYLIDQTGCSQQ